ncbi:MAG: hypothetical protein ACE5FK_05640, partial [Candidatus Methylomirabilia bacterium]
MIIIVLTRTVVLCLAAAAGLVLGPAMGLAVPRPFLIGGGLAAGGLLVLLEWSVGRIPLDRLFWGAVGGLAGLLTGVVLGAALTALVPNAGVGRGLLVLFLGYLGAVVALRKGEEL